MSLPTRETASRQVIGSKRLAPSCLSSFDPAWWYCGEKRVCVGAAVAVARMRGLDALAVLIFVCLVSSASSSQAPAALAQGRTSPPTAAPPPTAASLPAVVYAPGTSPTSLAKTLTVRSGHNVPSTVSTASNVTRSVAVHGSSQVHVKASSVKVVLDAKHNKHMELRDTDALDVSDDEAFDLVGTGNAKVAAGEMDDLASVFPDGCITRLVGDGANGTASGGGCTRGCPGGAGCGSPAATIPPTKLDTQISVNANFTLPQVISGNVRVVDGVLVSSSSGVTVEGARVHVASDTSHNVQIQTDDADFADVADNGGTTGLATGNAIVVTGEVEEPLRGAPGAASAGAVPHSNDSGRNSPVRRPTLGRKLLLQQAQRPAPPAAPLPQQVTPQPAASLVAYEQQQVLQGEQGMQLLLTMNITNSVDVDASRRVSRSHDVKLQGPRVGVRVGASGNTQVSAANGSSLFSVSLRRGCGGGGAAAGPSGSSSSSVRGTFAMVLNIITHVHVDARQTVQDSHGVALAGASVSVHVDAANNTQLSAANASVANVLGLVAGCQPPQKRPPKPALPPPLLAQIAKALHGLAQQLLAARGVGGS